MITQPFVPDLLIIISEMELEYKPGRKIFFMACYKKIGKEDFLLGKDVKNLTLTDRL